MIYDTMMNLARYKGIHPNLDQGLDFLIQTELSHLPLGKTIIDGDKIFVNIMEAALKSADDGQYEFHKKYLDIQFNLEGEEVMGIGFVSEDQSTEHDYDAASDFGTINCQKELFLPLGKDRFIICMLDEPHKPGIQGQLGKQVKKGVVKILME